MEPHTQCKLVLDTWLYKTFLVEVIPAGVASEAREELGAVLHTRHINTELFHNNDDSASLLDLALTRSMSKHCSSMKISPVFKMSNTWDLTTG